MCLKSSKKKKSGDKIVHAECRKVPEIEKVFNPYDYEIIMYEPNIDYMSDRQLAILLEHELLHIKIEDADGGVKYKTRGHDYDDFRTIIQKYGIDWDREEEITEGGWFRIDKTEPAAGEVVEVRGEVGDIMYKDKAVWTGEEWQYVDGTRSVPPDTWPEWRFCAPGPAEAGESEKVVIEEESA